MQSRHLCNHATNVDGVRFFGNYQMLLPTIVRTLKDNYRTSLVCIEIVKFLPYITPYLDSTGCHKSHTTVQKCWMSLSSFDQMG